MICAPLLGVVLLVAGDARSDAVVFNRDIRPILSARCFQCHGPDANRREAELRLDSAAGATADLGGHAAVVPKDLANSKLWERINSSDPDLRMPPAEAGKPLSGEQIELLRKWIESGAEYQPHWSFIALQRPPAPQPADAAWSRNPIDHFIRRRQESASLPGPAAKSLSPAPAADRATLLRRLSFDLTGLPPTLAELEAFVGDRRAGAYERVVDRLLASPRFGERMAIYWLDLVRYADTVGYHGDQEHHATMYREWVIRAWNQGMPFDRFTVQQLAGDLVPGAGDDQLAASGYNRLLQTTHEGGAQDKEYLAKYAADRVRNVSAVWMGATLGCAECHDHKYDPYTQRDFYSMAAFFADLKQKGNFGSDKRAPEKPLLSAPDRQAVAELDAALADLDAQISAAQASPEPQRAKPLVARRQQLANRRKAIAGRATLQMVSEAEATPRVTRILARGDWMDVSGEQVSPAGPAFLPPVGRDGTAEGRRTRLDLARWLVSRDQPQTARVLANRLWYLFFGEGLSRGLEDTGSQGQWPTHPELLDYLAAELIDGGWELKPLIRQLVTSSSYRQSSVVSAAALVADPLNEYWTRQQRFRLPAEMVRDQALAVSGLLVERIGGPSARPYQPAGYYAHLNFPQRKYKPDSGAGQYRRGVYMHWQRQFLHPMLQAFDAPMREECTAKRSPSNTPQAALVLLNDPSFVEAARRLAARALSEHDGEHNGEHDGDSDSDEDDDDDEQLRLAKLWRRTLSPPSDAELAVLRRLLDRRRQRYRQDPAAAAALLSTGLSPRGADAADAELAAWTCVARAVLSLSETITRE